MVTKVVRYAKYGAFNVEKTKDYGNLSNTKSYFSSNYHGSSLDGIYSSWFFNCDVRAELFRDDKFSTCVT